MFIIYLPGLAMSIQLSDVSGADDIRRENMTCLGIEESLLSCTSDYTTTSTETSVAAFVCHLREWNMLWRWWVGTLICHSSDRCLNHHMWNSIVLKFNLLLVLDVFCWEFSGTQWAYIDSFILGSLLLLSSEVWSYYLQLMVVLMESWDCWIQTLLIMA